MSDEGEKMCPLCAEEMDLTDQQLKPCKCGYQICVWCWHHIMEMAEKDESQGRCPACRTPYNKEKVVGMASKCERLVSEMNVEKKLKSHKGKSKTLEGRKQLDSVRVIQRNLVYVVGLPFHLAEENILQRKEYFGQYGKVLKVSISRTTTGAIQHFPNNTCSVYITYSKVEEAIRCIHMVHGFVLDGRRLRACFGTTKYCHAWLKNLPCSNPDCLYLHEIGSQEDSFTKDEIISAYTRNRVEQITGTTCSSQRRSGSTLPSPTLDNLENSAAFPVKSASKATANAHYLTGARVSPPDTRPGTSAAFSNTSSWGAPSPSYQFSASTTRVIGTPDPEPCLNDGITSVSRTAISLSQPSFVGEKVVHDGKTSTSQDPNAMERSEPTKVKTDGRASVAGISVSSLPLSQATSSIQSSNIPTTIPYSKTPDSAHSAILLSEPAEDFVDERDGDIENVCSAISSMHVHADQEPQNGYFEHIGNSVIGRTSDRDVDAMDVHGPSFLPIFHLGLQTQQPQSTLQQKETDSLSFPNEIVEAAESTVNRNVSQASTFSKHSSMPVRQSNVDGSIIGNPNRKVVDRNSSSRVSTSNLLDRYPESIFNSQENEDAIYSELSLGKDTRSFQRRYEREAGGCASDLGESSIISNILTSDFDPWNESFVSPQNLAKMFGEEKKQAYPGVIGSRRFHNATQSRFAFAREEDLSSQVPDFGQSGEDVSKQRFLVNNLFNGSSVQVERFDNQNVLSGMELDIFTNSHSQLTSSKLAVSRSQISAPPGFAGPNRLPPPGFPSVGMEHNILGSASGNHTPDASFYMRNQYPMSGNTYVNGDVEFIDPAILTVGKGTLATSNSTLGIDMRSSFPPQFGYEDPRVQRSSLSPYENQRFTDIRDTTTTGLADAYGISSRALEQKLLFNNNFSPFSQISVPHHQSRNGLPWDGWSGRNHLDMPEVIRTERRLGFNDLYSGHDDSKLRIPGPISDSVYNGGMYRF